MRPRLFALWRNLVNRTGVERDLDDELSAAFDALVDEKLRSGMTAEETQRAARLELGSLESLKDGVRDARAGVQVETLLQDLRYAFRSWRRSPGVPLIIIVTLALGIGANSAVFSIINALLLRSLPVKDPGQLALVIATPPSRQTNWTYPIWQEIRRHADAFGETFAWSGEDFSLTDGAETRRVAGIWTSGDMFEALGVTALLGRTLTSADDVPGGGRDGAVAVISHAFWQRSFGAARDVIGRTVRVDGVPFTIVGVTSPSFFGMSQGRSYDIAIPFGTETLFRGPTESRLNARSNWWVSVMFRLKAGQTFAQATGKLRALQPTIREATLPTDWTGSELETYLKAPFTAMPWSVRRSGLQRQYERPLMVLLVVVALVLVIACANIGNLLLARARARAHEWSLRLALGASRARLARQLLTESLLLSIIGAVAGLLVARAGSRLLVGQLSAETVRLDMPLDWRVLGFTTAVAASAALAFGAAPAVGASRRAPMEALKANGVRTPTGGRAAPAMSLVLAQVVFSVVLVVAAALFLRTFSALANTALRI